MSAPPLPETFGNYALGDFVEVVTPPPISWLPQTAGWWWLGAALALFAAYRAGKWLRRWYRNRYRREAARRLQQLATGDPGPQLVARINRLLKLTALAAFSREQVARLTGRHWVDFLNGQCQAAPFSPQLCELLAVGSYREQALDAETRRQLVVASARWIREHESPRDV